MNPDLFYFAGIIFFACFVQAAIGFGLPMIAMPVLVALLGIRTAAPLMAIVIFQLQIFMVLRYRKAMDRKMVWHISVAAVVGIPPGIFLLARVPETITVTLLGLLLIIYVLYATLRFPLPALANPRWAYLFGLLGGLGSGAYNMGAPPMIIYGDMQKWPPDKFKSNLQGYFIIITTVTMITHGLNGNITTGVWWQSSIALPFVVIGSLAGFYLDRFINPVVFRRLVLALLLLLGVNLAMSWR